MEKYILKMVSNPRLLERLSTDRVSLASSLGLSVQELLEAQRKPYFFLLANLIYKSGGSWKDKEAKFVAENALAEMGGINILQSPEEWFKD